MKKHYTGGKGGDGVFHFIINHMPEHKVYIETHLGGGSIFLNKKSAHVNILIEKSHTVIEDFLRIPHAKEFSIVNEDCMNFLKNYKFIDEELLFVDPPYMMETRNNQTRKRYEFEYEEKDHVELLTFLKSINTLVMLTAYQNPLYDDLLKDWYKFKFKAMTRGGQVEETLYTNFNPKNYIKHDYSYAGETATKRMALKKKSQRLINNLSHMPEDEKFYLLNKLIAHFKDEIKHFL